MPRLTRFCVKLAMDEASAAANSTRLRRRIEILCVRAGRAKQRELASKREV